MPSVSHEVYVCSSEFMREQADFGVVLPRLSLLATIAFAYSVLSPLINLLALISMYPYQLLSHLLIHLTGFMMFYLAWKFRKYNCLPPSVALWHAAVLTQVFDQPDERETGGLYFPMAVSNLCKSFVSFRNCHPRIYITSTAVVGLYIEQVCLACLFFLKVSTVGVSALVEGILMIVLVVITLSAQIFLNHSFSREWY